MRVRPWLEPRVWSSSNCSYSDTSAPRSRSAQAVAQPMIPAPTTATRVTAVPYARASRDRADPSGLPTPELTVRGAGRRCHGRPDPHRRAILPGRALRGTRAGIADAPRPWARPSRRDIDRAAAPRRGCGRRDAPCLARARGRDRRRADRLAPRRLRRRREVVPQSADPSELDLDGVAWSVGPASGEDGAGDDVSRVETRVLLRMVEECVP